MRKLGKLTESDLAISRELVSGGCRNYSARAAQIDLDALCGRGFYAIDGDTYNGYFIRHAASGRTVVKNFNPRELTILTVGLFRSASEPLVFRESGR